MAFQLELANYKSSKLCTLITFKSQSYCQLSYKLAIQSKYSPLIESFRFTSSFTLLSWWCESFSYAQPFQTSSNLSYHFSTIVISFVSHCFQNTILPFHIIFWNFLPMGLVSSIFKLDLSHYPCEQLSHVLSSICIVSDASFLIIDTSLCPSNHYSIFRIPQNSP